MNFGYEQPPPFLVIYPTLNVQKMKCHRCWRCCISTTEIPPHKVQTLWKAPPFAWLKIGDTSEPPLHICLVSGVNAEGQPHCLIYEDRPKACREYLCEQNGKQIPKHLYMRPLRQKLRRFKQHFTRKQQLPTAFL